MRGIYCGNFEYEASLREIEDLFLKYGDLDRVEMKQGFAFVYMQDERDAEDAIRGLDGREFGRQHRKLSVNWSKGDGAVKRREDARREVAKKIPSKTLFVVNFDPLQTTNRDLEKHFEPYGRLVRCQIRKNFAFVQYETQEEATKAFENCNNSKLDRRVLTVEYAAREEGDPPGQYNGPNRRSPPRSSYRSRSPVRRPRSRSPDYQPYNGGGRRRSPSPDPRYRQRSRSPGYRR